MEQHFGVCNNCGMGWHATAGGYPVLPARLPIDNKGSTFGAVCQMCAQDLTPEKIGELTLDAFANSNGKMPAEHVPGFTDTQDTSEAAEAIHKWVERQRTPIA